MSEGVQAMPTFAFFKNGEKLNQVNWMIQFGSQIVASAQRIKFDLAHHFVNITY